MKKKLVKKVRKVTTFETENSLCMIYAKKTPNKLTIKGIIFTNVLNHSESSMYCFEGKINIEFPQKSLPIPINMSFER